MAKRNRGINIFRNVPQASPNRTQFPILHDCDFSGDFGLGYPVFCQEVLPGDTWHISADHFSRLAPMIAPVYHDFDVRMHWFFVPMRLLWDDFEDWMTGGKNGTWREDNPDSFPVFSLRNVANNTSELIGSVYDFLGISTKFDGTNESGAIVTFATLPVMPVRGYVQIFNYFFRDQNIVDEVEVPLTSGFDEINSWMGYFYETKGLFRVSWDKDYFTSATLSPQRGPQVYIPLGSSAPVTFQNGVTGLTNVTYGVASNTGGVLPSSASLQLEDMQFQGPNAYRGMITSAPDGFTTTLKGNTELTATQLNTTQPIADLASAQGAAVDDVRESFALQRFFERMQVVGSRFAEFLRGIWGTSAGDARLQMPEYLGTWRNPFVINNVSNTTGTNENPQAGYAGNGLLSQYNKPIHKNFPENGYLYCIYSAMPRNGYQQGLAPIFCRRDWLDFANPYFEHIGEQPIKMQELYYDPTTDGFSKNEETFGYQSQYANYKFINSHSHGEFKTSLNFWHANRIFGNQPTLSQTFIQYNPSEATNRNFVLENEPKYYTTIRFDGYVERNLSAYSTPRVI